MTEKEYFCSHATMLYDTREKFNFDILKTFAHIGLKARRETFHTGDYTFEIDGESFKDKWIGERKGSLSELYGNVVSRGKTYKDEDARNNLEKELQRAKASKINEFILFVEGCRNMTEVRNFCFTKATKQGMIAGKHIYATITSWGCNNRYGFKVVCALTQNEIANEIINHAYYYWRNEMKSRYGDNFLKKVRELNENSQEQK